MDSNSTAQEKIKDEALARAEKYLRAAGLSDEESQKKVMELWQKLSASDHANLNWLIEEARYSIEPLLPKASNRPMKLGHMLAADFEKADYQVSISKNQPKLVNTK